MNQAMKSVDVLILDDHVNTALGVALRTRQILEEQGYIVQTTQCQSVDMVEELLEGGRIFDLAILDLGLHDVDTSTPYGSLGAIDLLSKAARKQGVSTKIVLHSDVSEDAKRALIAFAAFAWFKDVITLIPRISDLSPTIEQILEGQRRFPIADAFRKPEAKNAFLALFKQESSFPILRALAVTDSRVAAATLCNLSHRTVGKFISDHKEPFATFIAEVRKAGIIGNGGLEFDPESRAVHVAMHRFMAMQHVFLNDPFVITEFKKKKKERDWNEE